MRLPGGGVDKTFGGRAADLGKRLEQVEPDAPGCPAHIAVSESFLRPPIWRRINPAYDAQIVNPGLAARTRRKMRRNLQKLCVCQAN